MINHHDHLTLCVLVLQYQTCQIGNMPHTVICLCEHFLSLSGSELFLRRPIMPELNTQQTRVSGDPDDQPAKLKPHLVKALKWTTVCLVVFHYMWSYSMLLGVIVIWKIVGYLRWFEWKWFGGKGQYFVFRSSSQQWSHRFPQSREAWNKLFNLKTHGDFWLQKFRYHQEFWWRLMSGRHISVALLWNMYCPFPRWQIMEIDEATPGKFPSGFFWKKLLDWRYHAVYWKETYGHHRDFWGRIYRSKPISLTLLYNMFCPVQEWRVVEEARDWEQSETRRVWQKMFDPRYHHAYWRQTIGYHWEFWWRLLHRQPITSTLLWNMYCPVQEWRLEEEPGDGSGQASVTYVSQSLCLRNHKHWMSDTASQRCYGHCNVLKQYNTRVSKAQTLFKSRLLTYIIA